MTLSCSLSPQPHRTRRSSPAWSLALWGLCASACFEEPPTTTGDGSTTSSEDTGPTAVTSTTADDTTSADADSGEASCPATSTCVLLPPPGWQGPTAIVENDAAVPLSPCAAPYSGLAIEVFDQPIAAPAACSTCECDSATGVECSVPEVRFFNNSSCFGDPQSQFNMNDAGVCTVFTDSEGAYGAESDEVVPVVGTGSCTATGGGATLPNVQWGTQLRACETLPLEEAGCGDGRGCAPPPSAEFGEQLCIYRPGDVECPDGDFSERRVRYLDFEDNRGCTACECGSPTGGSCNVDIEFSYVDECIANYVTMTDPGGGCLTLFGEPPHSGEMVNTEVTGASCGAFGGEPQGVVAAADPVTVCCNG